MTRTVEHRWRAALEWFCAGFANADNAEQQNARMMISVQQHFMRIWNEWSHPENKTVIFVLSVRHALAQLCYFEHSKTALSPHSPRLEHRSTTTKTTHTSYAELYQLAYFIHSFKHFFCLSRAVPPASSRCHCYSHSTLTHTRIAALIFNLIRWLIELRAHNI